MSTQISSQMSQAEKRNLLSSFFVVVLIGLAYQEMIPPVRDSVRSLGVTFQTLALFSIFFMTSVRFFIGNQLHLTSDSLIKMPGFIWLYDLIVIISQCVLFIFMAGVTTLVQNQNARIGFFAILASIYMIDVVWIISQWLLGKINKNWRRGFIPWAWAILNTVLIIAILVSDYSIHDLYSNIGLIVMLLVNLTGFIFDVLLVDYYKVINEQGLF